MTEEIHAALALGPVRVAVDAGAHFGESALPLLDAGATVHAIEPCATNRSVLASNLRGRGLLTVHDFALSDADGEADFYVGCWSTIPSIDPRWPTEEFASDYVDPNATVRVETKRWQTFCAAANLIEVDFLKLDCEGMDARILRDLAVTGPWPGRVIAEVCSRGSLGAELYAAEIALAEQGYRVVQTWTLDGVKGRTNRLYVRDAR